MIGRSYGALAAVSKSRVAAPSLVQGDILIQVGFDKSKGKFQFARFREEDADSAAITSESLREEQRGDEQSHEADAVREAKAQAVELVWLGRRQLPSCCDRYETREFFDTIEEHVVEWREDGITWPILSEYMVEVFSVVSKPAQLFSRFSGDGKVLVNLSPEVLASDTKHAQQLQKSLNKHMIAEARTNASKTEKSKGEETEKKKKLKKTKGAATEAESTGEAKPSFSAEQWKELCGKLTEKVPDKDGKSPCRSWFIRGACPKGDECKWHHSGKAGSIR